MALHNIERIIKQLSIRLRLEPVIIGRVVGLLATGGRRPDVGIVSASVGVQGRGVGHGVGGGHGGGPLVVHALWHEVVGIIAARVVGGLASKVQVSGRIGCPSRGLLPILIMQTAISSRLASCHALARGGNLIETVLEYLVKMHRILALHLYCKLLTNH